MEKKETLLAFLRFLKERCSFSFNKDSFEDRLQLQKKVYVAGFLGLGHGYRFSRYIRGPYSPPLAKDYYSIESEELKRIEDYSSSLGSFDGERFLDLVGGKSTRWLEIAATVLSVWADYCNTFHGEELKKRVVLTVKGLKGSATSDEIPDIFSELERKGLLKTNC